MKVHRVDVGNRIRVDHKTPQGHARIPARFSRVGVQDYAQADGTVRREYRPPEEVFAKKSLDSFDTATVVVGHPAMIGPSNWKEHAAGDIRGTKRDGIYTAGDIVVRDQSTLDRINSDGEDQLTEISCGYDCMLEMTPGVTPSGEKYDAIQRDIVINHIGLGPKNWGRAGSEVRLRLDGVDVAYLTDAGDVTRPASMTLEEQLKAAQAKLEASEKAAATGNARADVAESKLGARTDTDLAKLDGELAQAKARVKELEAKPAVNVDAAVTARIAVLDGARILHGKDVPNAGTDRELMIAGVVARDPEFKADGKSDEYVRARFDFQVDTQKKAGASMTDLNRGTAPGTVQVQSHLDAAGGDAELAELMKRFDAAGDFLETYQRAEPWRVGEVAAEAAARKHLGLEH